MLALVLFASQLSSTTLRDRPAVVRLGIPALCLIVVGATILRRHAELMWSLAIASAVVAPYSAYHVARTWWRIPKPPAARTTPALANARDLPDIYLLMVDGCTLTSDYLDTDHYPDERLFPNLRRFLHDNSIWFYNAVSNGPETSCSLAPMLTGKLFVSRRNNYLANEATLFSILKPRYTIRNYLHTRSCFCVGENFQLCYPFVERNYEEPLRILGETWAHISSFGLAPISYAVGKLDAASYHRERFVEDFLAQADRDEESPRLYAIQPTASEDGWILPTP